MTAIETPAAPAATPAHGLSSALLVVIAIATGALAANLYYAQPLIAHIAPEIGIRPDLAGTVVSVTQIGYGLGLFFLVSLADLVENKRLVMFAMAGTVVALVGAGLSTVAPLFFLASLVVGLSSTAAQVLVPFASHLVPEAQRGRTVGNVMAGLLTGILLARPAALFISAAFGWRSVFWISAGLMVLIAILLAVMMPRRQPPGGLSYGRILASMVGLVRDIPILRRRAAYQALMFAGFNLFWTAAPIMLAQRFGLSEQGIALFALAGAGGALAAPIVGRLADRGLSRLCTIAVAMTMLAAGLLRQRVGCGRWGAGGAGDPRRADRCRGADQPDRRPAHHLQPRQGSARTGQRDLHDNIVLRRRDRFDPRHRELPLGRLDRDLRRRRPARAHRAGAVRHRAAKRLRAGAGGGTRTRTGIPPQDFKSCMSTIPSRPRPLVLSRAAGENSIPGAARRPRPAPIAESCR